MTTLENSYCVPKTEQWKHFEKQSDDDDIVMKWGGEIITSSLNGMGFTCKNRKEIPVQHFIDLVEDRISGWRLLEIGFIFIDGKYPYYEIKVGKRVALSWSELTAKSGIGFQLPDDDMWIIVTTFTDLLTLIKFLTPPTK